MHAGSSSSTSAAAAAPGAAAAAASAASSSDNGELRHSCCTLPALHRRRYPCGFCDPAACCTLCSAHVRCQQARRLPNKAWLPGICRLGRCDATLYRIQLPTAGLRMGVCVRALSLDYSAAHCRQRASAPGPPRRRGPWRPRRRPRPRPQQPVDELLVFDCGGGRRCCWRRQQFLWVLWLG